MDRQPICKTFVYGTKQWILNRKPHRIDGPAIEWVDGSKEWRLYGKRHRIDGPAVENSDGHKGWWLDGVEVPWQMVYHRATTDEARLSILVAALTAS